jgi:hypothetical protein
LQLNYRNQRRNDGHIYYDAIGDTDLEFKIERLRVEFAELRRAARFGLRNQRSPGSVT